jgi:hypothetical protein
MDRSQSWAGNPIDPFVRSVGAREEFPTMANAAYTLSMPQAEAFDHTLKALEDTGALIGTQIPPARIEFALTQREKTVVTLDIPLTGHVLTAKLPDGQTNATLTVGPSMQYVVYAVGIGAILLLFGNLVLGSLGGVWSVLVAAAIGYALWLLFAKLPGDALIVIGEKLRASDKVVGGGPAAPADATSPTPPPSPAKPQASANASKPIVTPAPAPQKALPTPADATPRPAP